MQICFSGKVHWKAKQCKKQPKQWNCNLTFQVTCNFFENILTEKYIIFSSTICSIGKAILIIFCWCQHLLLGKIYEIWCFLQKLHTPLHVHHHKQRKPCKFDNWHAFWSTYAPVLLKSFMKCVLLLYNRCWIFACVNARDVSPVWAAGGDTGGEGQGDLRPGTADQGPGSPV